MADNQINGILGAIKLTDQLQTVYTADNTNDGKQAIGTLQITSLDKLNVNYFDVVLVDSANNEFYYCEHHPISRSQTELRPVSLKDGQSVRVRVHNVETPMVISGISLGANTVFTVDTTATIENEDWVEIANVFGTTEVNDNRYKCTVLSANTFNIQDLSGNNIDSTSFTAYTSGGTATKSAGDCTMLAYEENIPQV